MSANDVVKYGITGLGGYAGFIRQIIEKAHIDTGFNTQKPGVKLHAVCEPDQSRHAELMGQLKQQGVAVYPDLDAMLRSDIEAVWLPVPIDLHRPFTEKSLAAGKAVMCEKPAAGCVDDMDAMIAVRDRTGLPMAIGFQHVYDPNVLNLKKRLLQGVIGKINRATLVGGWPRGDQYFNRASWVGAMKRHGVWVLDSPAMNAMAHYINAGLFFLSDNDQTTATPLAVEAELYRARSIENCDTVCLRIHLHDDVKFLVMLTHACPRTFNPKIVLHGSQGRVTWQHNDQAFIYDAQGKTIDQFKAESEAMHQCMLRRFTRAVRKLEPNDGPLATLEMARNHLVIINGAAQVARVQSVPATDVVEIRSADDCLRTINGIENIMNHCASRQQMLHESGRVNWSVPAQRCDLINYRHFPGPA